MLLHITRKEGDIGRVFNVSSQKTYIVCFDPRGHEVPKGGELWGVSRSSSHKELNKRKKEGSR